MKLLLPTVKICLKPSLYVEHFIYILHFSSVSLLCYLFFSRIPFCLWDEGFDVMRAAKF
jgi:hypothetical protein